MAMKKGFYFTTDAVIAASILITVVLATSMFYIQEQRTTDVNYLASDLITVLSTLKVGEITNPHIATLIADGNITNMNNTLLEQIGEFWAEGKDNAAMDLSREVIGNVMPQGFGYGIWIDDDETYNITGSQVNQLFAYRRMISGIEREKPLHGFTSTLFLRSIENRLTNSFVYFGGFVGEGNITTTILLPNNFSEIANIDEVVLEIDPGTDFKLYINDVFAGDFPAGSGGGGLMIPDRWTIDEGYHALFKNGTNNISIRFEYINENFTSSGPRFIGGGYMKIRYFSDDLEELDVKFIDNSTASKRYRFPGIEGFINLYSSIYIPGDVKGLSMFLNFNSTYETFMMIGNVTVYSNETNGTMTVHLNNQTLAQLFNDQGQNLSGIGLRTIPLRMGLGEIMLGSAPADLVLVTDVSGSMSADYMQSLSGGRMAGNSPYLAFQEAVTAGSSAVFTFDLVGVSFNYESLDVYGEGLSNGNIDLYVTPPGGAEVRAQCNSPPNPCSSPGTNRDEYYYHSSPVSGEWQIRIYSHTTQTVSASVYLSKIDAARYAGDNFVDAVLARSGPRIGLVSYEGSVDSLHELSDDASSLKNEIDSYAANGATCICCGILEATRILNPNNQSLLISRKGAGWRYDDTDRSSPPANWQTNAYDDSSWSRDTAVFRNNYWSLGNPSTVIDRYEGDYYFRKRFNITDAQSIAEAELFILSDNGADVYLNGILVDNHYGSRPEMEGNANYWNRNIALDVSDFQDGENVVAVRLYNRQTCFFIWCWATDVAFDLEIAASINSSLEEVRQRSMIVMSDGDANQHCGMDPVPDHDGDGSTTNDPHDHAIQAACDAYEKYGIRVHAVGFGDDYDEDTLIAIAACGNGKYYNTSTVADLDEIYRQIGNEEIAFSATQIANTTGVRKTVLFHDSYIEYNYTPIIDPPEFGKIPLTIEGTDFNNTQSSGSLYLPSTITLTDLKATSYSADKWTSHVSIAGSTVRPVFNLSHYGQQFQPLGDPFIIDIPTSAFMTGIGNNVTVKTGISPENMTGGSPKNRLIYSVRVDRFISPGGVFAEVVGCNWTFQLENGAYRELLVPASYNGSSRCYYTSERHDMNSSINSSQDGLQHGMFQIFSLFDFNRNGKVSVDLTENSLEIASYIQSGVPSMWGPAIAEVRVWR